MISIVSKRKWKEQRGVAGVIYGAVSRTSKGVGRRIIAGKDAQKVAVAFPNHPPLLGATLLLIDAIRDCRLPSRRAGTPDPE